MAEAATPDAAAAATGGRRNLPDVTIEVCNEHNRQLVWGPTCQILRGRWNGHNLCPGDQSDKGIFRMPQIPGMYITVSVNNRSCRIDDPLGLDENRSLMQEVSNVHNSVLDGPRTFVPSIVRDECDDDALATWLYWMARAVKSGNARIVSGRLPEKEEDILKLIRGATIKKKFFDAAEQAAMSQVRDAALMAASMNSP